MQAIIIAAGESSRFWPLNYRHKTLTKILGKPLVSFLVEELKSAGARDIIIVQSPQRDIEQELKDKSLKYAIQEKPTGTGDALLAAERFIKDEQFFLFNAEQQNIKARTKSILSEFKKGKQKLIVVASPTKTPWLFGVLRLRGSRVLEIVEKPKKGKEPTDLKNVGDYFLPKEFFSYLKKIPSHPYSLVQAISLYARANPVGLVKIKEETLFLKYPWHLFKIMESKLLAKDFKSFVSPKAVLGKNVVISGKVFILDNAKIGEGTIIKGPCYIGKDCELGSHNVLRGPVNLEDGVETSAFMEIKNSLVQEGTHFHSGYLGDSLIGRNCRFGAGFVSANRRIDRQNVFSLVKGEKIDTGLTSFGLVCGENSRFGIKTGTMPGVFVGSDRVIWPGTLIFKNLPNNVTTRPGLVDKQR